MSSSNPGRLARLAYTYMHIVLLAGIIVSAVGDDLVLSQPLGHAEPSSIAVLLGGPALYLIGNILFKRATASRMVLSHVVGLGLLAGLLAASAGMSPLLLGAASALVLVMVAAWETWSFKLPLASDQVGGSAAGS
jgi:low temperature requirement protein LtrA